MQGRVFSLVVAGSSAAFPLGIALLGPLADIMKIDILLIITGGFLILVAILMLSNRILH